MKLDGKTKAECLAMIEAIEKDPASQNDPDQLCLYNKKAVAKLDKLRRHITFLIDEERKAAGTYVFPGGYSGRKSNKRR